ncbi:hypothetical protein CsSME_00049389 [Camellia sinensis var. sinensis]
MYHDLVSLVVLTSTFCTVDQAIIKQYHRLLQLNQQLTIIVTTTSLEYVPTVTQPKPLFGGVVLKVPNRYATHVEFDRGKQDGPC